MRVALFHEVVPMHEFTELVDRSTSFTLTKLGELQDQLSAELEVSGSTIAVQNLQMIELQKAIMAVGMFSIFEAMIQDALGGSHSFSALRRLLEQERETDLLTSFNWYALAVNTLKHGKGRSYDELLTDVDRLPFRVKRQDEAFFFEGDVSEINTLVQVDEAFVLGCAEVIRDASIVVRRSNPTFA
jgi:hypothetical protein